MRFVRPVSPVASLALILLLAACGTFGATPNATTLPSDPDTPSAPAEESPSPSQSESPTPSVPEALQLDIPMVGRATEDVDVHQLPSLESPILIGESFSDPDARPEIRLPAGTLVLTTLGPVVAEGESWYEISSANVGGDTNFAGGWVPGRFLERESDMPEGFSPYYVTSGQGTGDSVTIDVDVGSPVSVRFAATPMSGAEECDFALTVTIPGGGDVEVFNETIDEPLVSEAGPQEFEELFVNQAGAVNVEAETECSFAISVVAP